MVTAASADTTAAAPLPAASTAGDAGASPAAEGMDVDQQGQAAPAAGATGADDAAPAAAAAAAAAPQQQQQTERERERQQQQREDARLSAIARRSLAQSLQQVVERRSGETDLEVIVSWLASCHLGQVSSKPCLWSAVVATGYALHACCWYTAGFDGDVSCRQQAGCAICINVIALAAEGDVHAFVVGPPFFYQCRATGKGGSGGTKSCGSTVLVQVFLPLALTAASRMLEPLLTNAETSRLFVERGGADLLLKLYQLPKLTVSLFLRM
jgi:hypothetical protein